MSKNFSLQRQLRALTQQNQVLRVKAQKIHEIESYVNILIQSSQSSNEQLNFSHQQNRSLKIQLDQVMAENVKIQKHYEHEITFIQKEFNHKLLRKDQEIRSLANARQKQAQIYEQKLSEQQIRYKNQIQRMKLEFYTLQKECQDQIHQLTALLAQKSHDLQLSEDSKNQLKKAYLQESNNISTEVSKLQRAYQQSQNQVFSLKEQLSRLTQLLDQLSSNESHLKRQIVRKEQQSLGDRKSYEKKIRILEENLNELSAKEKKAILKLNQSSLQNEKLLKQIASVSEQFTDLKHHSSKLQRLLNEKDQQIMQINLKLQQEEDQHKRHLKRHNQQLSRAQQQLNLTSERFLSEKRNSDAMKGEISDLLKVIEKLEENLNESEHNLEMVNKQNTVLFKQVQNITKQLKYRIEQLNDIDQKYKQSRQNLIGLQEMYKKQCIKSEALNQENTEIISRLQSITREQKILQQQQLSNMIQKHLSQKRQMLQSHRLQKQAMGKKFQQGLRQKDQQLKKRLELLEDEISLMRVRH